MSAPWPKMEELARSIDLLNGLDVYVLGVDPGFKATGLALLNGSGPVAVRTIYPQKAAAKDQEAANRLRLQGIYHAVLNFVADHKVNLAAVAIEKPDWHQPLNLMNAAGRKRYARERQAREALALIRADLAARIDMRNQMPGALPWQVIVVGVNEWHKQFGAGKKASIAELCWMMYQERIERRYVRGSWSYYWNGSKRPLTDHITDAIGIAWVAHYSLTHPQLDVRRDSVSPGE